MKTFKLKTCSEDFLTSYKADFETKYLKLYLSGDIKVFNNIFVESDFSEVYPHEITISELILPNKNNADYLQQNCLLMYEALKQIPTNLATSEEMWFTLQHSVFLPHLLQIIQNLKGEDKIKEKIRNMIFFTQDGTKSYYTHNLARYFWISYKTYDKQSTNAFKYTKFFTKTDPISKSFSFLSSKLTNNKNITLGIIEAVYELQNEGVIKNNRYTYNEVIKQLNIKGGVSILDIFTRQEIKEFSKQILLEYNKKL